MTALFRRSVKTRVLTSRLSSLLLLFQRSPIVQLLFPEARILGGAGLGEITKWSVAAIAGLGAFDRVVGATSVGQTLPASGSLNVTGALDADIGFNFQVIGAAGRTPASWTSVPKPAGLSIQNAAGRSSKLTGKPTQTGTFSNVVITGWENSNGTGQYSVKGTFTITIGPAIIATPPSSASIPSGTSTTLSVVGSGSPLTYQWYLGTSTSPTLATLITGATSASYTTPTLSANTDYFVRVTRGTLTATSNPVTSTSTTATVTIAAAATPATVISGPSSVTIDAGANPILTVSAGGTAPLTYQWYQGLSGVITTPVGANQTTFTPSPALSNTANYWVKVTNAANPSGANSTTATITVRDPFITWQNSQFSSLQLANPQISGPSADPDGDGITNETEYLFGSSPLLSDTSLSPSVAISGSNVALSFIAKLATGSGYYGKTRNYALQSSSSLDSPSWTVVSGFGSIVGANQLINYTAPASSTKQFYRLNVWLTP